MRGKYNLGSRRVGLEILHQRLLLHGHLDDSLVQLADQAHAAVEAQYVVHHPPRLQLGNAPLIGTPEFDNLDQVEIIWQTMTVGAGTSDSFVVDYRPADSETWTTVQLNTPVQTSVGTRTMHSATIDGLLWHTQYAYRMRHLREDQIVELFESEFQTRLNPTDQRPFSFAAYGDSATLSSIQKFRDVQAQINAHNPAFAILLGDNFYSRGTHDAADGRFAATINPEAVQWNQSHIDYFSVGNNDIATDDGQPSRDLFSVPLPRMGVNAHAQPPTDEFEEHNYSFDYGNVHFVTIDTNPVDLLLDPVEREKRVSGLIDYAAADLNASSAQWKIVFAHHPFIGTEKHQTDDLFRTKVLSSLRQAGADLFLAGHSHSYAWTYPLRDFADDNNDGNIQIDEVGFQEDTDRTYDKGAGVIQLVSGVGGNSLRGTTFDEPIFAAGYSSASSTGPLELGFAKIEVTQRDLTVSYISATDGSIMGDTNNNRIADADEPFFGQFRIVDTRIPVPDFDDDGRLTASDIDVLHAAIRDGNQQPRFDLDQDGQINRGDVSFLLSRFLNTTVGDANLDGVFNSADLVLVSQSNEFEDKDPLNSTWVEGDWNGDGDFTTRDLVLAFQVGAYVSASEPMFDARMLSDIAAALSWNTQRFE